MRTWTFCLALTLPLLACSGEDDETTGAGTTGDGTTHAASTVGESTSDDATTTATTADASSSTSSSGVTTTGDASTTTITTSASTATTSDDTTTGDPTDGTTGAPACDGDGLGPGDHTVTLMHGGKMRSALVHVPQSYDPFSPTPLVLNFHGLTSNAGQQVFFSGMNLTSDAEGFVVAYPEGINSSWNAGACCGDAMNQQIDDVGFVRALVEDLEALLCVDERRIYATGMSNGGFMSHRLACEAADVFAAAAPVSATMVLGQCAPSRPIPVMMFNGTADSLVFYDGGLYPSAPKTFADWGDRDLCVGAPVVSKQVGATTCELYESCADDVQVAFCTHEGMGHCWPGNAFCPIGQANTDLDANAEMWAFFSKFALP